MDAIRRAWAQIQAFFAQLSSSTKWLIGALVVILLLVGFVVLQYAAAPETVAIAQAGPKSGEIKGKLQARGINPSEQNGQIVVPVDRRDEAYAVLAENALLGSDTLAALDQMVAHQSLLQSNKDKDQAYLIAKQKVLSAIVSKMEGVQAAHVLVSLPEERGFGRPAGRPGASVTIFMKPGKPVSKPLVEAVAGLVAHGAVADMSPQDVVVVDANQGRHWKVDSPEDSMPSGLLEMVRQTEQVHQRKIEDLLSYIPGVIVAVNVQTDPVRQTQKETTSYDKAEPLLEEYSKESTRSDSAPGGEPGARSNTGVSIEGGGSPGSSETVNERRTNFGPKPVLERSTSVIAGHTAKQINCSINVPRSYFVALFRQGKNDAAAEPDEAALKPVVDAQLAQIQGMVEPLVSTEGSKGIVKAAMIPDRAVLAAGGLGAPQVAGGGLSMVLDSGWAKPAGLAGLALFAVGLMLYLSRNATKAPPMPSAEELAGVPPPLINEDDLVGEAAEGDTSLTAIELDEEEIRHRKISEQIAEMVKANPAEAAGLVRKWVRTQE